MTNVISFKPKEKKLVGPEGACPLCDGQNGQHNRIKIAYPWPFNLCVFKTPLCPVGNDEGPKYA